MSKDKKETKNKKKKTGDKFEIPRSGVNRIYDAIFQLDGIDKIFDAIPDEETKREILNFTAGLSAKFTTEIEKMEKNLTPDHARKLYASIAKDLGKSQKEIFETVESLEESEKHMERNMRREMKRMDEEKAKKAKQETSEE